MRYFTYIAEQSFKTSITGERLFCCGGPWSRPYLIPDAGTEQKLYQKSVWTLRALLGGSIITQPLLFVFYPQLISKPIWFFLYSVFFVAAWWAVWRAVFARDLKGLQRAQVRLRPRLFYGQAAQRHSKAGLALGFLGSLLFVAAGIWVLSIGANYVIGILSIAFFGLCAVAWGYSLYLKFSEGESPDRSNK